MLFFCLLHQFTFINSANIFLLPAKYSIFQLSTVYTLAKHTSIFVACYKTIDLFSILHLRNWAIANSCAVCEAVSVSLFHLRLFFFSLTHFDGSTEKLREKFTRFNAKCVIRDPLPLSIWSRSVSPFHSSSSFNVPTHKTGNHLRNFKPTME